MTGADLSTQDAVCQEPFNLAGEQVPQRARAQCGVFACEAYEAMDHWPGQFILDPAIGQELGRRRRREAN
jgi:hypothetical protein